LDNLQWIFKKTDGITEDILKTKVIGALESDAGKEALKQMSLKQVINLTGLDDLTEATKVQAIINHLNNSDNFNIIFKVVE
jgi:hypothetical protein